MSGTRPSPSKQRAAKATKGHTGRVVVQNVNVPGYTTTVEAPKYHAMKHALLKVLPAKPPGLTQTEIRTKVVAFLPGSLFPGGAKAEWWSKCVQLDLEAKGTIVREATKPLRWHRNRSS
jgi:hypothetical protein